MSKSPESSQLRREIGLVSAIVLVVANMVGSGIFTTSGFIMAELGSPSALLVCWLIGGLFALAGALCYGELGAMLPKAGGEYAYLRHAFGPVPAFISGWISLIVGFSAPIAAAAIAFATYFLGGSGNSWFVLEFAGRQWIDVSAVTVLACSTVIVFSLVHCHSIRFGAGLQNLLTLFKVLFIILFVVVGLGWGKGDPANFRELLPDTTGGAGSFAVALIFVSFAYSGWNAAAYLGGEIRNPGRNLPLSLMIGTSLVIIIYMMLNVVYIYALPAQAMSNTLEVGTAAAAALLGERTGSVFGLAIALGLLSVLSAMIMAGPRVYFAMARDGLFFSYFGKVHATRNTPAPAISLQALIAVIMILCAAYNTLLIYIGFTLSLASILTVSCLFYLRQRDPLINRPYRTFGYPLVPLFFILGNIWIIIYTIANRPVIGLWGIVTVAAGGLLYLLFRLEKYPGQNKHPQSVYYD